MSMEETAAEPGTRRDAVTTTGGIADERDREIAGTVKRSCGTFPRRISRVAGGGGRGAELGSTEITAHGLGQVGKRGPALVAKTGGSGGRRSTASMADASDGCRRSSTEPMRKAPRTTSTFATFAQETITWNTPEATQRTRRRPGQGASK